jgi:phenylalanyl-tRNA synthetase beta chain
VIGPALLKKLDIAHKHDVVILDIDPAVYTAYSGFNRKVKDIVAFPAVTRDLNFKMSGEINVGDVCASINSVNQSILQNVKPVDIYQSKNDKSSKDVLFKLTFQSPKKTLEDKDVNSVITEIINVVSKKFNAKLRDN